MTMMPTGLQPRRAEIGGEASLRWSETRREAGQQDPVCWFDDGTVLAYKIKYPEWRHRCVPWLGKQPSGKTVTAKDTITRSVKISNNGNGVLAEDSAAAVIDVTGVSPDKSTTTAAVAATTTLNVTHWRQPAQAIHLPGHHHGMQVKPR